MKCTASSVVRRRSNTGRIDHLYQDPHEPDRRFILHHGDMSDSTNIIRIIQSVQPDEIYNLAAQSHVAVSFETPEYTANSDALGPLRILEAIRILRSGAQNALLSGIYIRTLWQGSVDAADGVDSFYPRSPYGVAKLYAYWITVNYREAYGLYACNGILFNHESPLRGETFLTRKVTRAVAQLVTGAQSCLYLGNLEAKRDWGHAKDYVEAQWLMLQQDIPEDFVIATGQQHSVRDFVNRAFGEVGIQLHWSGEGVDEVGTVANGPPGNLGGCQRGDVVIRIDPAYFRPAEVDSLLGDAAKARARLGWTPKIDFPTLVREMIEADMALVKHRSPRV